MDMNMNEIFVNDCTDGLKVTNQQPYQRDKNNLKHKKHKAIMYSVKTISNRMSRAFLTWTYNVVRTYIGRIEVLYEMVPEKSMKFASESCN